jgi:hypothetical protein
VCGQVRNVSPNLAALVVRIFFGRVLELPALRPPDARRESDRLADDLGGVIDLALALAANPPPGLGEPPDGLQDLVDRARALERQLRAATTTDDMLQLRDLVKEWVCVNGAPS